MDSGLTSASLRRPGMMRLTKVDTPAPRVLTKAKPVSKSSKLEDLNVPVSSLYLLAAPSTPEEARQAAVEAATDGEWCTGASGAKGAGRPMGDVEPRAALTSARDDVKDRGCCNPARLEGR